MAVCTKCGTPLADGINFCGKCGTPVQHEPVVSSVLTKSKNTTTTSAISDGENIGKITDNEGNVYEGDFVDGKLNGKGKITSPSGDVVEGDFVDGVFCKGKITFADGDIYEGDIVDGKYHGKGKYTQADGDVREGDFVNGVMEGIGKYTFADGDMCEGNFVNGKLNGKGKITKTDGSILECNFEDGKIIGNATYTFPDNDDTQEDTAETEDMSDTDDFGVTDGGSNDYDIIVNDAGEIMVGLRARKIEPSSPQAFRTADKSIVLKRSADELVMIDSLPDEKFEYFTKVDKILVNEIDDEGETIHLYEVPLSDQ